MRIFRDFARPIAWALAGIGVGLAVSAHSEIADLINPPSTTGCSGLQQAMQDAVNKKVQLIGMTSPDPGKYFNAGSPDSCLGNLSIANLDLSKLIPDPLGLFTGGLDNVIDALKKAALGAACVAVRNSGGDTIYKYNAAIRDVNGIVDVNGRTNQLIDTTIADTSRKAMDGYAMNWKTPQYSADVTSGIQVTNAPVKLPVISGVTTPSAAATTAAPTSNSSSGGLGASIFN